MSVFVTVAQARPAEVEGLYLTIRQDPYEKDLYFLIKKTSPFCLFFAQFCLKTNADPLGLKFVFNERRILPNETPEQVFRCELRMSRTNVNVRIGIAPNGELGRH